jgi:hypothetical protein
MIWIIRKQCILEAVIYTNMKELENIIETNKVYLEMFHMQSVNLSAELQRVLDFFPCTQQL